MLGAAWFGLAATGEANEPTPGGQLLPADLPVEQVIDSSIDARIKSEQIEPAPPADDAAFLRRVTLDLAGRTPLAVEVQAYLDSSEPDKREKLVDRLLASPDFAYQQRNEIDTLLMAGKGSGEWRDWLYQACEERRPWPQLFREIVLAREDDPRQKHALTFLKSRASNLDDLTNDTSKLFFGVSINCAKCHDHPLVLDWTQDHYYGMASFFSRTYLTKKNFLAERADGGLKFKTTAGEEKEARPMFLTGAALSEEAAAPLSAEEQQALEERQKADNDRDTPPDPPAASRRAQLVELALRPDPNAFFARAFVNRLWARLLGTGLVMPLDQMHAENKPSHPELLAWLARDAESHQYDAARLIRGIVLSRAYGRSSRWDGAGERPSDRLFAVAAVRPLSPMQFSLALTVATAHPFELAERLVRPEDWASRRRDLENHARGFAEQLEIPSENFQVGVSEALLFSNSGFVEQEHLRDSADRLIGALRGISDREQMIRQMFLAVASRPPTTEEAAAVTAYLAQREDRPVAALQQVLWSLISSGEFRFNH